MLTRRARAGNLTISYCKKTSWRQFFMSMSCYGQWISLSHFQSSLQIHCYFDNVMTKFMISVKTDAWKPDVNLLSVPYSCHRHSTFSKTWRLIWNASEISYNMKFRGHYCSRRPESFWIGDHEFLIIRTRMLYVNRYEPLWSNWSSYAERYYYKLYKKN